MQATLDFIQHEASDDQLDEIIKTVQQTRLNTLVRIVRPGEPKEQHVARQ